MIMEITVDSNIVAVCVELKIKGKNAVGVMNYVVLVVGDNALQREVGEGKRVKLRAAVGDCDNGAVNGQLCFGGLLLLLDGLVRVVE